MNHIAQSRSGSSSKLGIVVLIFLGWWIYNIIKKRREAKLKEKFFKRNDGLILQWKLSSTDGNVEKSKLFNSKGLEKATDHFNKDRILGKGGEGTVYKGDNNVWEDRCSQEICWNRWA